MIRGERVILRAIERADLPNYVAWLNDERVVEYMGRFLPWTLNQEEGWYDRMLDDDRVCNLAIEYEGKHIGGAGFSDIDARTRSAQVGLFIGLPELWDRGLGYDVLHTLLKFGFEQMNLNRIALQVFEENQRAVHLYEKVGFQREGRWRQADFRHGRYHDMLWMSVLRDEWQG